MADTALKFGPEWLRALTTEPQGGTDGGGITHPLLLIPPHVLNINFTNVLTMGCHPCRAISPESKMKKEVQNLLTDLNWCDVGGRHVLSMNALLSSKDYVLSTCYLQQIQIGNSDVLEDKNQLDFLSN